MPPAPAPAAVDGFVHGGEHGGVLAHAEIVVGAPDGDGAALAAVEVGGAGEIAGAAFQVGEYAVAAFGAQPVQLGVEERLEIHTLFLHARAPAARAPASAFVGYRMVDSNHCGGLHWPL